MSKYVSTKEAAERLGVCQNTVREYANAGKIDYIRTPGGQRRYRVDSLTSEKPTRIGYCRVSTPSQRDDLERQVQYLR